MNFNPSEGLFNETEAQNQLGVGLLESLESDPYTEQNSRKINSNFEELMVFVISSDV